MEKLMVKEKDSFLDKINKRFLRKKIIKTLHENENTDELYRIFFEIKPKYKAFASYVIQEEIKRNNRLLKKVKDYSSVDEDGNFVRRINVYDLNGIELLKDMDPTLDFEETSDYLSKTTKWLEPKDIPEALKAFLSNEELIKLQKPDSYAIKYWVDMFMSKNPKSLTDESIDKLLKYGCNEFDVQYLRDNPNLINFPGIRITGQIDKELVLKYPQLIKNLSADEKRKINITMEDVYNNRNILLNPEYDQFLPTPESLEDFKRLPELLDKTEIDERFIESYLNKFRRTIDEKAQERKKIKDEFVDQDIQHLMLIKEKIDKLQSYRGFSYKDVVYNFNIKGMMPLFEAIEKAKKSRVNIIKDFREGNKNNAWLDIDGMLYNYLKAEETLPKEFCEDIEKQFYNPNSIVGIHTSNEDDYQSFFKEGLRNRNKYENSETAQDLTFTVRLQKSKYTPDGEELYHLLNYPLFSKTRIAICVPTNAIYRDENASAIPIWKVQERFDNDHISKTTLLPNFIMGAYSEKEDRYVRNPEFDLQKRYPQQKVNGLDVFVPNKNYNIEKEKSK